MLIKEYRIPLPLTVEEYRIAQLYMIAKKSREESKGAGSGVEILVNEPYEDGPGGRGQYTHKIYHVGSHLPGWFKGLLPKSALTAEEMAWNAYPYTKTRYTCPFVQKFSIEIETCYLPDNGHQENVFKLSGSDLRNRVVDVIDVVKDQLHGADYVREEDPRVYTSQKTCRGPIGENWLEEYWDECKDKPMPLPNGKAIMTAYKLCKVEFHYWGMQSKIEKFIHDVALRKTMLRAHRQAWAWQDEWFGLTMDDIREIERETQEALKRKMAALQEGLDYEESEDASQTNPRGSSTSSSVGNADQHQSASNSPNLSQTSSQNNSPVDALAASPFDGGGGGRTPTATPISPTATTIKVSVSDMSDLDGIQGEATPILKRPTSPGTLSARSSSSSKNPRRKEQHSSHHHHHHHHTRPKSSSKSSLNSPSSASNKSLELLASLRMETLSRKDSDSGSEDEFFDCLDQDDSQCLTKWSSMDLLPCESEPQQTGSCERGTGERSSRLNQSAASSGTVLKRGASTGRTNRDRSRSRALSSRGSIEASLPGSPTLYPGGGGGGSNSSGGSCTTTVLCLVMHAGSALDATMDLPTKKSDVTTFRGAFESVIRQHYPSMLGHVSIRLVPLPSVCTDALGILSSLSPYSFDVYGMGESPRMTHESVPIGAIPLLCSSQLEYYDAVGKTVAASNQVYHEFLRSEEGQGFAGSIVFIGDSIGSILAYDALTRHYSSQSGQCCDEDTVPLSPAQTAAMEHDHLSATMNTNTTGDRRRSSSSTSDCGSAKLEFEVSDFFMFGSPLGLVLALRKVHSDDKSFQVGRPCQQVYNLFHPTDPLATRLEPLISARFAAIPPVNVARYAKYPLGDGQPYHLLECIQCNQHLFSESGAIAALTSHGGASGAGGRRFSDISIQSEMSGLVDVLPLQAINQLTQKWWGSKRVDYAVYCPDGLANFPTNSLPHLFHASYWESTDAIAFILRQIGFQDISSHMVGQDDNKEVRVFAPNQPREKWIKKRTSVKLKNVAANHRANDVIVKEGLPQTLRARFMYGPLDMVSLTGEKIDIFVMKDPPMGEWIQLASEITDKNGRIAYTIPTDKALGYGIYPVKMIVRGDHTCADFYLAIVPPKTECVVFSIDGSFTASMSVTGRDPRVRAGAVDVVRHWQELGYLIIYVTGRPDMQQHKVVSWLAQHNFPHGLVSFADGLSTDFLGHKADYLKSLVHEQGLVIQAAYGSSKDISVYTSMGLPAEKIYIVGKVAKKQHTLATVLSDGYSTHLNSLSIHGGSRPAQGNARMVIPRGYFGLPGQPISMRRRRSAKRTTSFPTTMTGGGGGEGPVAPPRGLSPRQKSPFMSK